MKYSDKLIKEYQQYMKDKYGEEVSDAEAQLHVASLARLFTAFAFSKDKPASSRTL